MSAEKTITEIKDLISDPESQLTTKTGLRLLLTVSSEMWEQMELINKTLEGIVTKQAEQEEKIKELQSHNIMLWAQKNPKWAVSVFTLFIIMMDIIVDKMSLSMTWKYVEALLLKSVGI